MQYRQGFLGLPLGLSRKEVDGGQGRELPPQGAYGLGQGGIRRLNRLEEFGVVSLAIKEGHEGLPLGFITAIEAVNSGSALHAFHVFGNGPQRLRVGGRVGQEIDPVAQGGAPQGAQGPPDAHTAGGLLGGERDKEGQKAHGKATLLESSVKSITIMSRCN